MTIIDASQNEVNGGSLRLAAVKNNNSLSSKISSEVKWLLSQEKNHDLHSLDSFKVFQKNVQRQKFDLITLLEILKEKGKTVIGYGASTKGNTILQYCGISPDLLSFEGVITLSKDGTYCPATKIPIISLKIAKEMIVKHFLLQK